VINKIFAMCLNMVLDKGVGIHTLSSAGVEGPPHAFDRDIERVGIERVGLSFNYYFNTPPYVDSNYILISEVRHVAYLMKIG
jgi:hypothetical protein